MRLHSRRAAPQNSGEWLAVLKQQTYRGRSGVPTLGSAEVLDCRRSSLLEFVDQGDEAGGEGRIDAL